MPLPALEVPDRDVAEAQQLADSIEEMLSRVPSVHLVPPEETRAGRRSGSGLYGPPVFDDRARWEEVPGRAGSVRVRVFEPEAPAGTYLHIHGGGWVLGAADLQDPALRALAEEAQMTVVSVEYRLAPEYPYPAGADDCEDVARWLAGPGAGQLGPAPLVIGGESAGAHLAVLTMLRLRDGGLGGAIAAANLVFGCYDLSMTPSQRLWGDRNLVLSTPIMAWFYDCFLPGMPEPARRDPAVSPLYADLHGLPPALFTVGTLDPLLDDTLFMSARWEVAGGQVVVDVHPAAIHGFTGFPIAAGGVARSRAAAFLRSHLTG